MIWAIEEKGGYHWYNSDMCRLRITDSGNKQYIWLNYKDYNIVMPMEMWGFGEEISERGIKYSIEGDGVANWYFVIEKENLRLFIDLIYFFIAEHNADKMIRSELRINNWD